MRYQTYDNEGYVKQHTPATQDPQNPYPTEKVSPKNAKQQYNNKTNKQITYNPLKISTL